MAAPARSPRRTRLAVLRAAVIACALASNLGTAVPATPAVAWDRLSRNELPRSFGVAIYDPVGDRMIFYATDYEDPDGHENEIFNVLALSLGPNPTWTDLEVAGPTPPRRISPSAIYDPVGHRMILHSGLSGTAGNDTWALSLGPNPTWSEIVTTGDLPPARRDHTAIYDPVGHRMIIHGGHPDETDVFTLSLGANPTWTRIVPAGPVIGHENAAAIYDPVGHRMIVDGGEFYFNGGGTQESDETWVLSLGATPTWSSLTPAANLPPRHGRHAVVYDPARHVLILFGGTLRDAPNESNMTWELSLGPNPQWTEIVPPDPLPPARFDHHAVFDPVDDRLSLFGGRRFGVGPEEPVLDDHWALSRGANPAWTPFAPDGPPPNPAEHSTVVFDPVSESLVVYGGLPVTEKPATPLRAFPLVGPPVWRELHPAGTAPATTYRHSTIYDAVNHRMIVFGGIENDGGAVTGRTWALSLGATPEWTEILASGTAPDPLHSHSAIYDASRRRMVVFGGVSPVGGMRGEVWALSLDADPTWTQIFNGGLLAGHSAIYDEPRQRMVVFGGIDAFGNRSNTTLVLDLGENPAWSGLPSTAGTPPTKRRDHSAIYDPVGHRMVVFGGDDNGIIFGDVWVRPLWKSPSNWDQINTAEPSPSNRFGHGAIYDPRDGRMVVAGGSRVAHEPDAVADAWAMPLESCPPPIVVAHPAPLTLPLGATATFSAGATGAVGYRWRKNGTPMNNGGRISGALTPTLTIVNIQASDVAGYSVQITGACDGETAISDTAALRLAPACGFGHATPPSGMAAWWAMDEGPGNTTPDVLNLIGNKNHASLTGAAVRVTGMVGDAVRCEGVDDGLHVPSTLSPQLAANSTGLSIDAWILPRSGSAPGARRMILQKGLLRRGTVPHGNATALAPGYALYLTDGRLGFQMPDPDYYPVTFEPAMSPMTMDAWHHVAVTATPAPGGGRFYIDGAPVATFTPSSGIFGNLADLYIGRFAPTNPVGAAAFHGDLDEVEIFTAAIDAAAVQQIWAAGCSGKRRVQLLGSTSASFRGATGRAEVCGEVRNLSAGPHEYQWAIQSLAPAAGCPSLVPVTFTPASGTFTVAAADHEGIVSTASVSASALTAPFSVCYRLTVTDLGDGATLTAGGVLTHTLAHQTGRGSCPSPLLGSASNPSAGIHSQNGIATFTVFNDSSATVSLDYRIDARAPGGAPSTLLALDGLPAGAPVNGTVVVPAWSTADLPVSVSLAGYEPFIADELVLSADVDGDAVLDPLARMHVHSLPDTSLLLVDVIPSPGPGAEVGLRAAPNPFGGSTTIEFGLDRSRRVELEIFDLSGRRVRRLAAEVLAAGEQRRTWDGRDDAGAPSGAGLYFVRLGLDGVERAVQRVARVR